MFKMCERVGRWDWLYLVRKIIYGGGRVYSYLLRDILRWQDELIHLVQRGRILNCTKGSVKQGVKNWWVTTHNGKLHAQNPKEKIKIDDKLSNYSGYGEFNDITRK